MRKLICLLLVAVAASSAFAQNAAESLKQKLTQYDKAIINEKDPNRRSTLIIERYKLEQRFYDPDIRSDFVAGNNLPASNVKTSTSSKASDLEEPSSDIPLSPISTYSQFWDKYTAKQKISYCYKIKDLCSKGNNLEYCRLVVTKCQDYLKPEDYNDIITKYSDRP